MTNPGTIPTVVLTMACVGLMVTLLIVSNREASREKTQAEIFTEHCRKVGGEPLFYGSQAHCFPSGGKRL